MTKCMLKTFHSFICKREKKEIVCFASTHFAGQVYSLRKSILAKAFYRPRVLDFFKKKNVCNVNIFCNCDPHSLSFSIGLDIGKGCRWMFIHCNLLKVNIIFCLDFRERWSIVGKHTSNLHLLKSNKK